jgi:glutathione S-transferase
MPHLSFSYFGGEAGRLFGPRAALTLKKVPFQLELLTFEQWSDKTLSGNRDKFPLGNVPVLYVDGKPLCESIAINMYVGQLTGLWPTDPLESARALEILLVTEIIWTGAPEGPDDHNLISTYYMSGDALKAAREGPVTRRIQYNFSYLDKIVGDAGFAVGGKLSIVDFWLAQFVVGITTGHFEFIDPAVAAPFTKLLRIAERFMGDGELAPIVGPLLALK